MSLLFLMIALMIQTVPSYCAVTNTTIFHLSVTIPEHVIYNSRIKEALFSRNPYQMAQTQTVVRNHKPVSLTSIVVP